MFPDGFTFSLVRDPWARLVSHWAFHIRSKEPLDGGFLTSAQRLACATNETHSIHYFRLWVRHARRERPPDAHDAWKFTTVRDGRCCTAPAPRERTASVPRPTSSTVGL